MTIPSGAFTTSTDVFTISSGFSVKRIYFKGDDVVIQEGNVITFLELN